MKFVRTGEFKENALELPREILPIERAQKSALKRLNYLLGFIKEMQPDILANYVDKLKSKLREKFSGIETQTYDSSSVDYSIRIRRIRGVQ